jgi:hypothetical protein
MFYMFYNVEGASELVGFRLSLIRCGYLREDVRASVGASFFVTTRAPRRFPLLRVNL